LGKRGGGKRAVGLLADPHLVAGAQVEAATQLCGQHQPPSIIKPRRPTHLMHVGNHSRDPQ